MDCLRGRIEKLLNQVKGCSVWVTVFYEDGRKDTVPASEAATEILRSKTQKPAITRIAVPEGAPGSVSSFIDALLNSSMDEEE